ncbi:uncharacterized protein CEXT_759861 [Caerostris extrusa]|uniref:Reverse transcriptase domain-containing protein n=1 Tax=Caerostris extrusa TaxID=172846 RepID=A0AAV4MJP6_CAEEX|nr:uncharacterized protein CEXT_759861 [Caerostris extrusa]
MPKDKAPGPDGLDGRILNLFYKLDPTKMLQLYNKCIMMGSFPTSFKYGEGNRKIIYDLQKGCPQGSCLGPFLWTLIANLILKETWEEDVKLQAFADDFIFIISANNRRTLETKQQQLSKISILGNKRKTKDFRGQNPGNSIREKRNSKRKPILKFSNWTIKCNSTLKYLGVLLDQNLSFLPHIQHLKSTLLIKSNKLATMSGRGWSINPKFTRQCRVVAGGRHGIHAIHLNSLKGLKLEFLELLTIESRSGALICTRRLSKRNAPSDHH